MSFLLLDIAISLIVVFVLLSVFCSGLLEWYAQRVGARARFLCKGMLHMLGDDALYRQVVNHPLIESLGRGRSGGPGPAYIPSALFADALIDSIAERANKIATGESKLDTSALNLDGLRGYLVTLDGAKFSIASSLAPIVRRSDNLDRVRAEIAKWYEAQTDRVSGWYKAYVRKHLFLIGLIVAVLFNIDIIAISKQVEREPGLRTVLLGYVSNPDFLKLAAQADESLSPQKDNTAQAVTAAEQAKKLLTQAQSKGLPFGWTGDLFEKWMSPWPNLLKICLQLAGWLLTALGVSLGAPFWFDLLNKLASLRGGGPKPASV